MPKRARKKQGANVRKERRLALCPSKHQRTGASCTTEEKIAGKGWINRKLVLLVTSGTSNTLSTSTIISTTSSSPTTTATIATAPAGAYTATAIAMLPSKEMEACERYSTPHGRLQPGQGGCGALGTAPWWVCAALARHPGERPSAEDVVVMAGKPPLAPGSRKDLRMKTLPKAESGRERRKILSPAKRNQSQRPREGGCR